MRPCSVPPDVLSKADSGRSCPELFPLSPRWVGPYFFGLVSLLRADNGAPTVAVDRTLRTSTPSRSSFIGLPQANVQLAQLLLVHRRRRVREQVLRALRLGEGDDVADRLGARHHRDDAVQAEGDAAVRR